MIFIIHFNNYLELYKFLAENIIELALMLILLTLYIYRFYDQNDKKEICVFILKVTVGILLFFALPFIFS